MLIRPMALDDAEAVAALSEELGYPTTGAQAAHRLGLIQERAEQAVFVAEEADERVAGWVHVYGAYALESDPYALIAGLVVQRQMRGQGAGRALVEAAEQWAAARGYDEIRLRSNVAREDAHAFYQHLGYEITKTSYQLRKPL